MSDVYADFGDDLTADIRLKEQMDDIASQIEDAERRLAASDKSQEERLDTLTHVFAQLTVWRIDHVRGKMQANQVEMDELKTETREMISELKQMVA